MTTVDPDDVRLTIDDLRRAWRWLAELVEPSRETSPTRAVSDHQAEVLAARGMSDRAYRQWNLRHGRTALPPTPAAAQLEAIDAQAAVHSIVMGAARMAATSQRVSYVGARGDQVLEVLGWLDGTGRVLAPWVVDDGGDCWRRGVLDELSPTMLAAVDADLQRADRTARQAARVVGEAVREVPQRCPACGRRSLQLDYEDEDHRRWTVRCISGRCVCKGAGCGCLQRSRRPGRRHAWAYGELSGPYGLANAVAVAAALAADADRAAGRDRAVRSAAVGHGGWADRRADG